MSKECEHANFVAGVQVHRLTDTPEGPVTSYVADVRIRCEACGANFVFVGPPMGVSFIMPMVSPDRTELRAPIQPPSRAKMLEVS